VKDEDSVNLRTDDAIRIASLQPDADPGTL